MFERYHISFSDAPGRCRPVPKFEIVRADNCANCGKCERACIYGVHKRSDQDPRKMADPVSSLCKNCFRCIAECPQRALSMRLGDEYKSLGRGIWTPNRIVTIWSEAETGRIPVFGAGYRGMFAGPGFDGMWTDMSEIVRPTRDGIHGREYISTSVDIGSKPNALEFGDGGRLATKLPPIIEQPVPVVLDVTRLRAVTEAMIEGFARAAKRLQCLMMVPAESVPEQPALNGNLVPVYAEGSAVASVSIPEGVRMVELAMGRSWKAHLKSFRKSHPGVLLGFRLYAGPDVEKRVLELVGAGVDVAHILFDEQGHEEGKDPSRHSKEVLRAVHKALVSKAMRDEITVIAGGGIAAAEHVPKTVICGADVVAIERALVIALECRDCITCSLASCPVNLSGASPEWVEARVCNMVGAWRDQLLEILGAMGLREVRRLRGELGRAIFFEDVQRESFAGIEGGGSDG